MKTLRLHLSIGLVTFLLTMVLVPTAGAQNNGDSTAPGGVPQTFKAKCQMCHGPDGSGNTPAGKKFGAKDLKSSEVQKNTDAELTAMINKGKDKMPAYGTKLQSSEIKELVAYIRQLAKGK
jgi:cytochrome c6